MESVTSSLGASLTSETRKEPLGLGPLLEVLERAPQMKIADSFNEILEIFDSKDLANLIKKVKIVRKYLQEQGREKDADKVKGVLQYLRRTEVQTSALMLLNGVRHLPAQRPRRKTIASTTRRQLKVVVPKGSKTAPDSPSKGFEESEPPVEVLALQRMKWERPKSSRGIRIDEAPEWEGGYNRGLFDFKFEKYKKQTTNGSEDAGLMLSPKEK